MILRIRGSLKGKAKTGAAVARVEKANLAEVTLLVARVEEATLAEATLLVARVEAAILAEATLLVALAEAAILAEVTLLVALVEEAIVETEAEVLRTPEAEIVCPRVPNRASPRMTDNGLPAIVHPPSATPSLAVSPVRLPHLPSEFVPL